MTVYSGSAGIAQLREKIKQKSKMLGSESTEQIAIYLIDNSVVGGRYYNSRGDLIENDQGDFKNSWQVAFGEPNKEYREADSTGAGAVASAIVTSKTYDMQDEMFVTNNIGHAEKVEEGWEANPQYGWEAKDGYHLVRDSKGTATAILMSVAEKVSKL